MDFSVSYITAITELGSSNNIFNLINSIIIQLHFVEITLNEESESKENDHIESTIKQSPSIRAK